MLLQCAAMVAKKLPVGDKITASVRQICLLVVVCKVLNRKTLSSKTLCFSYIHTYIHTYINFIKVSRYLAKS